LNCGKRKWRSGVVEEWSGACPTKTKEEASLSDFDEGKGGEEWKSGGMQALKGMAALKLLRLIGSKTGSSLQNRTAKAGALTERGWR